MNLAAAITAANAAAFCFWGDCGARIWEVGKDDQVTIINVFGRGERAGMSIYNVSSTDQSAESTESND